MDPFKLWAKPFCPTLWWKGTIPTSDRRYIISVTGSVQKNGAFWNVMYMSHLCIIHNVISETMHPVIRLLLLHARNQLWKVTKYTYSSTELKYNFEVFIFYLSISIFYYSILSILLSIPPHFRWKYCYFYWSTFIWQLHFLVAFQIKILR